MCTQALDAMAEIQERHEAVKDLERSLVDLHQIFLDMSVLVDAQGEMLDNIEQQVRSNTNILLNAKGCAHLLSRLLLEWLVFYVTAHKCLLQTQPCSTCVYNGMHEHQETSAMYLLQPATC